MELGHRDFAMERLMSETIKKIDQMEKESIIGLMVIIIRENFQMG